MNRSSTAMSAHLDRVLGAVDHRQARLAFLFRRYGAVAEDLPVPLLVVAEQARRQVVAAAMALTAFGIYLYLHCVIPISVWCRRGPPPPGSAARPTRPRRPRAGPA